MKKKNKHKVRIYNDSKDLPFCNYKRIVQTGDFYYMVKGYEPGDTISVDLKELEDRFNAIEEDYAMSINGKNGDVVLYGNHAIAINEFNKFNIIVQLIDLTIKSIEIRAFVGLPESEELNSQNIKNLLQDFKVQKSGDIYKQRVFVNNKLEKLKNQISKLESQINKVVEEKNVTEIDIEEQFVSVCLGLEKPVDDTKITLYQYGLMVKALIRRVEELNKIKTNAR